MGKTKHPPKEDTKGRAGPVPKRHIIVTRPDGTTSERILGPKPKVRGGIRKSYVRQRAKTYAWNTKRRKTGTIKRKDMPRSHYKALTDEQKAAIQPMSFALLPGEVRNMIYSALLDKIEDYRLIFANWTSGPVAGWPASRTPHAPIGFLSSGDRGLRKECLSLAYEKADIHVRILSAHLKSAEELYAWVSNTDCISFSSLNTSLITKISLTIFLPCSFEVIGPGQGINYAFLTRMTRLQALQLRTQVNVPNPHDIPWLTFHSPIPVELFTPFVHTTLKQLFRHVRQSVKIEFGDGVAKEDGGLGTWVDKRADDQSDQGWMVNPLLLSMPGAGIRAEDTVAVPIEQMEEVFGSLRKHQGTADIFTRDNPIVVEGGDVEWRHGRGSGRSMEDPILLEAI